MKAPFPAFLIMSFLISSHVSMRGSQPALVLAPAQAAQQADNWACEDEPPEDAHPLAKREAEVAVVQVQSLGPIRDVAEAFTEAFPELKIAASEANRLVIIGGDRPRQQHYLKVAKEAVRQLDVPGLQRGYYVGNHIVRLKGGNACAIAEAFRNPVKADPSSSDPIKPTKLKVIGLSEKVLVIVPTEFPVSKDPEKSKDPKTKYEFPIELERKVASLRSSLMKAGEGLAKAKEKEKEDAVKKSRKIKIEDIDARKVAQALKDQFPGYTVSAENEKTLIITPEKAKPSTSAAEPIPAKTPAYSPAKAKKEQPGKQQAAEIKTTTSEDWLVERTVQLRGLKATDVAKALRNKIPGFQIRAISADRLVILGGAQAPATPEEVKKTVAALDESAKPKDPPQRAQGEFVRLFHLRDAAAVAAAFKRGTDEPVKAVGPDLLLIDPPDGKLDTIWAIKRILAVLDLPRPQIGLQVWSMQVSATDRAAIEKRLEDLRGNVNKYNGTLQRSLQTGWETLRAKINKPNAVDEDFRNYIEKDFLSCSRDNRYCLGYRDAFLASSPSLTRMLLFLAALNEPSAAIEDVISTMKKPDDKKPTPPDFKYLRAALVDLLKKGENLDAFRAAILDFLFNYKWAIVYPRDLVPYDLKHSAHVLDSMLTPIHDALAQDLRLFIETLREPYKDPVSQVGKNEKFYSSGIIRVTTLSGTQAKSTDKTSNYFDITMPITLDELLKQNDLIGKGLPGVFQPKEALLAGIPANLLTHPKVIAEVGRGMTLAITPTALETAAAAELRVELESGEDAPPAAVSGPADKKPAIDRVTKSTVSDTVRVESLKLFEISTFGMDVEYRKDFVLPIVGDIWQAVFGSVPVLNGLFRWPGAILENRSHGRIAIVGAMVVPTATDLGYSIRFEADRELVSEGANRIPDAQRLFADAGTYHRQKMRCLRGSNEETCIKSDRGKKLEMSDVIGDEHEIKSEVK